jgi:hypothetical protein
MLVSLVECTHACMQVAGRESRMHARSRELDRSHLPIVASLVDRPPLQSMQHPSREQACLWLPIVHRKGSFLCLVLHKVRVG